jgi:hypothetical protein
MLVRLTCDRAGPTGFHNEGEVIDLPRKEALRLIAARQADQVEAQEAVADNDATERRGGSGTKGKRT